MAGIIKVDRVQSDSNLAFNIGGSNVAYFNTDGINMTGNQIITGNGILRTTSGMLYANNGIAFPGTQSSSSDPNTLDDYEEGTWTPVYQEGAISGTSIAYVGRYTKVGNLVTLFFQASSDSANIQVSSYVGFSGIPFAASRNGTSTVVTEDIDVFARQGFMTVGGGLFLSACGSSSGTGALRGTITYFTS